MDRHPLPFFAFWLFTNPYGRKWLNPGWRKFGIHFVMWFAGVSLGLGAVNLSGAAFDWAWIVLVFCAIALPVPYHEWQEHKARLQDTEKTLIDCGAVILGVLAACLAAGAWWWQR